MKAVEEVVLEIYRQINELPLDEKVDLDIDIGRENGFDSLGIVTFIVEVEDALDIDLDNKLAQIRQCKTLRDMISIIESAKN